MNVFVLNTGRCGSTTFIKACKHIENFTSAHESRCGLIGAARFSYPDNHIEADNRLSWFLGRLDKCYGDNAVYVHLTRNNKATANSFVNRYSFGIIEAYRDAILMNLPAESDPMSVSLDYCDTVNSNIDLFLKDKTKKMDFRLEEAKHDFKRFWEFIGAEGNIDGALQEFDVSYNASRLSNDDGAKKRLLPIRIIRRFVTLILRFYNTTRTRNIS